MMADKPILFSAPMARAILREIEAPGTGKTQTRRIVQPYEDVPHPFNGSKAAPANLMAVKVPARLGGYIAGPMFNPRFARGDRLWVREAWRSSRDYDGYPPRGMMDCPIYYEADGELGAGGRLRPSIHMPRWASRLTLHVTDVRVQRLQDISEADARAEGLSPASKDGKIWKWGIPDRDGLPGNDDDGWDWCDWNADARLAFRHLWDSLNAERAPWSINPWVVAITFRAVLENIDRVAA